MADPKVWVAAFCTIGCLSFIYGDNILYQFCEHALLGFTAAHLIVQGYFNVVGKAWTPLVVKGELVWLWPLLGGLALYLRFFKPVAWVARLPLAFLVGGGAGVSVFRSMDSEFLKQLAATCSMTWKTPKSAFYLICVLLALSYFVISVRQESRAGRVLLRSGKIGQCLMMIAFGASLGMGIAGHISVLIGRLRFLLGTWLGLIG